VFVRRSLETRSLISAMAKRDDLLAGKPDNDPTGGGPHLVNAPQGDVTVEQAAQDFLANRSTSLVKLYTRAMRASFWVIATFASRKIITSS
jgi:hypothetical protein